MSYHERIARMGRRRSKPEIDDDARRAGQGPDIHEAAITADAALVQPPIGVMMEWPAPGDTQDGKWLVCDGRSVPIDNYPELFGLIGYSWGIIPPAAGFFYIPDRRGRVGVGAGQGAGLTDRPLGSRFGEEVHLNTSDEMPSHAHGSSTQSHDLTHNHPAGVGGTSLSHSHGGATGTDSHFHGGSTGVAGAHDHAAYAAGDSANDSTSQGWPNGNAHNAFRSTDRVRDFAMHSAAISGVGNHSHPIELNTHGHSIPSDLGTHAHVINVNTVGGLHSHGILAEGGNFAHNNMQPSVAVSYIIRALP